jgi:hypothetical protein
MLEQQNADTVRSPGATFGREDPGRARWRRRHCLAATRQPPGKAPRPARQVEDGDDDLTPVQRFERAIQRRDSATPKRPSRNGKKYDWAR